MIEEHHSFLHSPHSLQLNRSIAEGYMKHFQQTRNTLRLDLLRKRGSTHNPSVKDTGMKLPMDK